MELDAPDQPLPVDPDVHDLWACQQDPPQPRFSVECPGDVCEEAMSEEKVSLADVFPPKMSMTHLKDDKTGRHKIQMRCDRKIPAPEESFYFNMHADEAVFEKLLKFRSPKTEKFVNWFVDMSGLYHSRFVVIRDADLAATPETAVVQRISYELKAVWPAMQIEVEIECADGRRFRSSAASPAQYRMERYMEMGELVVYEDSCLPHCTLVPTPYVRDPRSKSKTISTHEYRGWATCRLIRKRVSTAMTLVDAPFRKAQDPQGRRLVITFTADKGDCEDVINFDYIDWPAYSSNAIVTNGGWNGPRWPASVKRSWFLDAHRLLKKAANNDELWVWAHDGKGSVLSDKPHKQKLLRVEFRARFLEDSYGHLACQTRVDMNDLIEVVLFTKNAATGIVSEFASAASPRVSPDHIWSPCRMRRLGRVEVNPDMSPFVIILEVELK